MNWPPNKAWTSSSSFNGFRHFVAINYGGRGSARWVNMVSVLDSKVRLRVLWHEMNDTSKWASGWLQLSRDEANIPSTSRFKEDNLIQKREEVCLHPSADSGLNIPCDVNSPRPWFLE